MAEDGLRILFGENPVETDAKRGVAPGHLVEVRDHGVGDGAVRHQEDGDRGFGPGIWNEKPVFAAARDGQDHRWNPAGRA